MRATSTSECSGSTPAPNGNDDCRCWCPLDVHVCAVGSEAILLDLRQDKYFSVPARAARALSHTVPGWPTATSSELEHLPPLSESEMRRTVEFYLNSGVLTAIESEGKSAKPIHYPPPRDLVPLGFDLDITRSISWHDARNFLYASTLAAYRWRTLPLHAVVRKVAARKARTIKLEPFDDRLAADLACTYRRLQAFVFTGRNRCLLQALSFANFLSFYGLFPDWVFGVQTRPFAAHCWLQHNHYLLNETPEGVKRFTPIFAV
jgi:Transglutaminase-like superfamily